LAAIRGKSGISSVKYLKVILEALTEDIFREAKGSGSTFPNITSARLLAQQFPVPSIDIQEKAGEIVDRFRKSEKTTLNHLGTIRFFSKRFMSENRGSAHV
jgi:restriction endonuclease S subunit